MKQKREKPSTQTFRISQCIFHLRTEALDPVYVWDFGVIMLGIQKNWVSNLVWFSVIRQMAKSIWKPIYYLETNLDSVITKYKENDILKQKSNGGIKSWVLLRLWLGVMDQALKCLCSYHSVTISVE